MLLRCIDPRAHFILGEVYDVAEIAGWPHHAMIRKDDGSWPIPYERNFGWHADEFFERPNEPIETVDCGYFRHLGELFGVRIRDVALSDSVREYSQGGVLYPQVWAIPDALMYEGRGPLLYVGYDFFGLCKVGSFEVGTERIANVLRRFDMSSHIDSIRYFDYEHYTQKPSADADE